MASRIDLSSGFAHVQIYGHVTWDDFRNAFARMLEHPDYRPGMDALWDTRGADFSQFTSPELVRFGEFVMERGATRDGARGALVLPDAGDHGLSQMYDTLQKLELPVRMKVFRNLAEAEAWLASGADPAADAGAARPRDEEGP